MKTHAIFSLWLISMALLCNTPQSYGSPVNNVKKTIRTPSSVMQKRKQKNSPSTKSSKSRTGSVSKKRSVSTNKTKPL
ncbi:hypothetical protein CP10743SC13_0791A, partial [Chlamydia psittaci 10_743_SC13]